MARASASAFRRALVGTLTPMLAPFVVPLLANDAVVRDVVRSLRKVAPAVTGMLLDHLVDPEADPRVRRRIPRILKVCRSQRAATGLLLGLRDPVFDVRLQIGIALTHLAEDTSIKLERDAVLDLAVHELTTGRTTWAVTVEADQPSSGEADPPSKPDASGLRRGLAHVFAVLGLVLEREPLSIAYRALRSEDPNLRGTAFEYLEVALPARVRELLLPLIDNMKPATRDRESDGTIFSLGSFPPMVRAF